MIDPRRATYAAATAVIFLSAFVSVPVEADEWPIARHDGQRTAASSATLSVERPTVAWRHYLGGALNDRQVIAIDVDRDGSSEAVFASGGRVIAKRADNSVVWESPIILAERIIRAVDVDGDSSLEIVVAGRLGVQVLSSTDGSLRWQFEHGTGKPIGSVTSVLVADFNSDQKPDLFFGDCGCCAFPGTNPGIAYSFAAGASSPSELWRAPTTARPINICNGSGSDAVGDVTGDGVPEAFIIATVPGITRAMAVVDGSNGSLVGHLPGIGLVFTRQTDGTPENEIFLSGNLSDGAETVDAALYRRRDLPSGQKFERIWNALGSSPASTSTARTVAGAVADFDGVPPLEVAVTVTVAGVPRVEIRRLTDGAVLDTLPSTSLQAVADISGDGLPDLTVGGTIEGYRFVGGELVRHFALPAGGNYGLAITSDDERLSTQGFAASSRAVVNLDSDPAAELIAVDGAGALHSFDVDTGAPIELGTFQTQNGVGLIALKPGANLTANEPQVMVATSDGYLTVLNKALVATNNNREGEFTVPGIRIGGFYTGALGVTQTPLIARMSAAASAGEWGVLQHDSRGALLRLDVANASFVSPPKKVWEQAGAAWPAPIDTNGDGTRDLIVTFQGRNAVAFAAADTAARWTTDAMGAAAATAITPIRRDGVERGVVTSAVEAVGQLRYSFIDSLGVATRTSMLPINHNFGLAVAELTGDDDDDVLHIGYNDRVISGANASVPLEVYNILDGLPMIAEWSGGGVKRAFLHAGHANISQRLVTPVVATPSSLTVGALFQPNGEQFLNSFGAKVQCAGVPAVVFGKSTAPDLWTARPSDGTVVAHRVLAGGEVYDAAAPPAGSPASYVGNVNAVAEVSPGRPGVLAGSTDGFLYALDPCTLEKIWSLNLRFPVGEAIVGNAAGTGEDQIIVTAANGYLYGVASAKYDAPVVNDTDPANGVTEDDVDEAETIATLHAKWTAIPGATSYEVGVVTETGNEVTYPNYRIQSETEAAFSGLSLKVGTRYFASVRAIGPDGIGLEGRSDGVTVRGDVGAPIAALTATGCGYFEGDSRIELTGSCSDATDLRAELDVSILDGSGAVVDRVTSFGSGNRREVSITWDGKLSDGSTAAEGDYTARLSCIDTAAKQTDATASFRVARANCPAAAGNIEAESCGCDGTRTGISLSLAFVALWLMRRKRATRFV